VKSAKISLALIVISVIVLGLIMAGLFTIVSDTETQFKREYTTDWSNSLDANPFTTEQKLNDNEFIDITATRVTKHDFYGQEIIVLARIVGEDTSIGGVRLGGSSFRNLGEYVFRFVPRTLDLSTIDVYVAGASSISSVISFKTLINVQKPFYLILESDGGTSIGGRLVIDYIGHKAQFECNLASDEVSIQESFAQTFTINDLSFPVTKWMYPCRPATLRDIQQGETPITPNPYPALNRGELLQVPLNQIVTVNYATPNVAGTTNPCDVDSANIKVAGRWVCSQVIKTTTITREIPKTEIVKVSGANVFSFTSTNQQNTFNIGSSQFSASQNFKCQFPSDVDIISVPNPDISCYSSTISYEGKSYEMLNKQVFKLSDNIFVQYFASGSMKRNDGSIINELQGDYVFSITEPIKIELEGGLSFKQNNKGVIKLKITNNLPDNKITLRMQQTIDRLNLNLPEMIIELQAGTGVNYYDVEVDTSSLGINKIIVQAFYPIQANAQVILPSDRIIINVEILGEQQSIVKFVEVEKEKIVLVKSNLFIEIWDKITAWIKSLFR